MVARYFKLTHLITKMVSMLSNNFPDNKPLPAQDQEKTENEKKSEQQQSDPPLTEIKGVTDPEDYEEPKVEEEPER